VALGQQAIEKKVAVQARIEPLGGLLVDERGKAGAFWAPSGVQLNHILAVVDTPLKRWQIPQSLHRANNALGK
jgi:hypothetical protein